MAIVSLFALRVWGAAQVEGFAILGGIAVAMCDLATGLYRHRIWARYLAAVFSAISLLGFPVGTIINGYILYLLLSAKGTMMFSDEYQQVMEQTRHIRYQTAIIVNFLLVVLLVALGGTFIAMLFVG